MVRKAFMICLHVMTYVCVCGTYRLMELRLNEPDFLLRVVQMIRSLKRKRERSFFPPTVFYRERKNRKSSECFNTLTAKNINVMVANICYICDSL